MSGVNSIGSDNNVPNNNQINSNHLEKQASSIFNDLNNNNVIDKADFKNVEDYNLAKAKGYIGKFWSMLKQPLEKLLNQDKSTTEEMRHNAATDENYKAELDENGVEVSRTYFNEDGSIDEVIHFEYDKDGNVVGKSHTDSDGNVTLLQKVKDGEVSRSQYYDEEGNLSRVNEKLYDEQGNFAGEKVSRYEDTEGNKYEYVKSASFADAEGYDDKEEFYDADGNVTQRFTYREGGYTLVETGNQIQILDKDDNDVTSSPEARLLFKGLIPED